MTRPEVPGKTIRRLRGVVPLTVATRKPHPLSIALDGAKGKTFRNDDVALTVNDVRTLGNTRQTTIELTVRPLSGSASGLSYGPAGADFLARRPDAFQQQIEVSDAQGRVLHWFPNNLDADSSRLTLAVTPRGGEPNGEPAEVRFFGLARSATDLAFEFNDLPLP
jgi:hypothetical protein